MANPRVLLGVVVSFKVEAKVYSSKEWGRYSNSQSNSKGTKAVLDKLGVLIA